MIPRPPRSPRTNTLFPYTTLFRSLHLQRIDDAAGDVVLDREHVLHLAVVGFRPEVRVGSGIDQLRRDAHVLAGAAYAAFEYRADAQLSRHGGDAGLLALEHERGGARRDLELRQLRQQVEDFLGDAVAEVFVHGVDRTSVVAGTSVSGRLGLGGGRLIKKK